MQVLDVDDIFGRIDAKHVAALTQPSLHVRPLDSRWALSNFPCFR